MIKIFVSHPLAGDFEGNRRKVDKICKYLTRKGYLPISPLHLFDFIEEETEDTRYEILDICYYLIELSDEVWIYGDSEGCRLEREYAKAIGKPVEIFYKEGGAD